MINLIDHLKILKELNLCVTRVLDHGEKDIPRTVEFRKENHNNGGKGK
jgi:hypothetical protein